MEPKKILALCRERNVKAVDLRFMDFPGLWQHFTIPVSKLEEHRKEYHKAMAEREAAKVEIATAQMHQAESHMSTGLRSAEVEALDQLPDADIREALAANIVARLNPEQARAVTTTEGPLLILAGASLAEDWLRNRAPRRPHFLDED